ncbi:protein-tyrosine phosphatase-like protein, partial [Thamnocephalis sphaerospora]
AGLQHPGSNRYCNVWPYDRNRVCLPAAPSLDSDYINASRITASIQHTMAPNYVVCQGPMPTTFAAFWWMCWSEHANVVVMLTQQLEHGRLKCHVYWPAKVDERVVYGDIAVRLLEQCPLPSNLEGVERIFELTHLASGEKRRLHQLQYTGWPDCGVPEDPRTIVWLRELVQSRRNQGADVASGPVVVHCSAGCGRSGTFCVLDTLLADIEHQRTQTTGTPASDARPSDDDTIRRLVALFRMQRIGMVQTFSQFILCYEALL